MGRIREIEPNEDLPLDLLLLADPELNVLESYIHRSLCYVLEKENEIIGAYLLLPTRPMTIELVNVAVMESMQGKGFGKKLVMHAIETARSLKYQTIEVGTGNSGMSQIALYQKCGFRLNGIDRDFFVRHYSSPIFENGIQCRDMVRMDLQLMH